MSQLKKYIVLACCLFQVISVFSQELSEADRRRFDYFYLESVRMRNLGKYAQSYELLKHALMINSNAPEALFDMASFSSFLVSKEEMVSNYERAVELSPKNLWYKQVLGNSYYRSNQLDKAIEVYEQMAKDSSDKVDVFYDLLGLYTQKQDYEKCIWALNKIESLDGKSEQLSMEKFRMYLRLEQKDKAFLEMEALSKEYPNDTRYRINLGDLYLDDGHPKKALEIYQQILKEEPQNVQAQLSMVSYLEKQNKKKEAEKSLEELALNPTVDSQTRVSVLRKIIFNSEEAKEDSTKVLNLFDRIMEQPQDGPEVALLWTQYKAMKNMSNDEIGASLRTVVKIDPGNVAARLQLMQYAFDKEDFDDAIQLCQEAIEYTPEEVPFYYYQGLSYYQSQRGDQALEIFRKGLNYITDDTDKELVSNMYGAMGDIYHEKKMDKQAYEVYDSALVYKPDNTLVLNNYAYYLALEKKDLEKAEAMSFRTLKADPKAYNELDTYAWILFLEKKYIEAKIYIEQALKNGGDQHAGIVEHAGDIFYVNGEVEQALVYWEQADKLGSDSKTLKKKIKQRKYIGD